MDILDKMKIVEKCFNKINTKIKFISADDEGIEVIGNNQRYIIRVFTLDEIAEEVLNYEDMKNYKLKDKLKEAVKDYIKKTKNNEDLNFIFGDVFPVYVGNVDEYYIFADIEEYAL